MSHIHPAEAVAVALAVINIAISFLLDRYKEKLEDAEQAKKLASEYLEAGEIGAAKAMLNEAAK